MARKKLKWRMIKVGMVIIDRSAVIAAIIAYFALIALVLAFAVGNAHLDKKIDILKEKYNEMLGDCNGGTIHDFDDEFFRMQSLSDCKA